MSKADMRRQLEALTAGKPIERYPEGMSTRRLRGLVKAAEENAKPAEQSQAA